MGTKKKPLTEELIKRLHALVEVGPRAKPTPYREGQNAIKNSSTGALIYLPPEAEDVPSLMASLVAWADQAERSGLPAPLIAGLVHYQFVTIHPYYDGNGRTARLLATFILHKGGYGLNGFFSLEEHHARDLPGYYQALTTHPHHNYYFGRSEADVTPWLEYFISTLAAVFEAVRLTAQSAPLKGGRPSRRSCVAWIIGQGWCSASLLQRKPSPLLRWQQSLASPSAWPGTF
ncbi:Fic family protein [Methanothrix sp.]|uniref:Fic family protein n=1 Tax=Methanothrix sp. TaxID=90426 RepID=UPI00345EFE66